MSFYSGKFRVTIQSLNIKSVLSSSLQETKCNRSKNNKTITSIGSKLKLDDNFLKGIDNSFNSQGRIFYNGISFQERWDQIQRYLSVLGRVSSGNTVVVYRDSGEAFRVMWKAIDESKKSVLWQTYICKDDHVGRVTVGKMEAAHRRGCYTELLYDCGGNITGRRRLVGNLVQSGASVIQHRPFFDHFWKYILGGMKWERSPAIRNHRKILITDDKIGFCGGLNIGDEYCGRGQGGTGRFRDTHCAVRGPAVTHLRDVYEDTKAPKPWRWGLTRWRQIAAAAVYRKYRAGQRVRDAFLLPITTSVQQRGKIYLRRQMAKAGVQTAAIMEHIRWKRQRERLEQLMRWYQTGMIEKTSENLTNIEKQVNNNNNNNNNNGGRSRGRSNLMKQKTEQYRKRALYRAQTSLERRLGAKGLLLTSLNDTDPVPEAESYSKTVPNVTQILCCNPHTRDWSIPYALWQVSQKAHRRLWVTTPYYLPHRKLMRAIINAAKRGVDVRILSGGNYTTDPWFMWYASNYITERLLVAGVRVYEYKGDQIMHAKTVVVDSIWSSVGSYNWDMMSNKNMEVCLCHLDYNLAREMENHFLSDLKESIEIKYDEYRHRSWWLRFASWFFYVVLQIAEKLSFRTFWDADLSSEVDGLD